jgi:hypothetical protein
VTMIGRYRVAGEDLVREGGENVCVLISEK